MPLRALSILCALVLAFGPTGLARNWHAATAHGALEAAGCAHGPCAPAPEAPTPAPDQDRDDHGACPVCQHLATAPSALPGPVSSAPALPTLAGRVLAPCEPRPASAEAPPASARDPPRA